MLLDHSYSWYPRFLSIQPKPSTLNPESAKTFYIEASQEPVTAAWTESYKPCGGTGLPASLCPRPEAAASLALRYGDPLESLGWGLGLGSYWGT